MGVTIEDVAREAGVSIATVSRFINGQTVAIAPATRERLQRAVDRLGYVPNAAARTLKTGRTRLIGVALADIAHMYWSAMLSGIEEGCARLGYSVVIGSASNRSAVQSEQVALFVRQKVDGLLLNPTEIDEATVSRWAALRCPIVMLDRTVPGLPFPLVAVDNAYGARLAVEYLLSLGHRRIAFITWPVANFSNRQERLDGYREALTEAGLPVDPALIRVAEESWDDGVRQTVALFSQPNRPTAVFSANMELNLQVLAGLKQLGLRIPDDVSVVGFDDSPWDPLLDPPLTTIATPPRRLGMLAALRLCRAAERGDHLSQRESRLKPHLIVRRSAAPAPHSES
ncbi:MAG TPA: LacI family DNA-binding transcriptional regulator [Thermomicrobiales bacterium]